MLETKVDLPNVGEIFYGITCESQETSLIAFSQLANFSLWENSSDRILGFRPDFIKAILVFSEEFEKRKDDPAYFGQKGLNPKLLPNLVTKASP